MFFEFLTFGTIRALSHEGFSGLPIEIWDLVHNDLLGHSDFTDFFRWANPFIFLCGMGYFIASTTYPYFSGLPIVGRFSLVAEGKLGTTVTVFGHNKREGPCKVPTDRGPLRLRVTRDQRVRSK